jgi:hypothetical protein
MTPRTFLEMVGKLYSSNAIGSARVWEIHHLRKDPALPPLIYVVESEAGLQFLIGRETSGRPKFNLIRYIAQSFVELFFEQFKGKELSQYFILGGLILCGSSLCKFLFLLPAGKPKGDEADKTETHNPSNNDRPRRKNAFLYCR